MTDTLSPLHAQGALSRTPPANLEGEQALLGTLLANNTAYEQIADFLLPDHFAHGLHATLYSAIVRMIDKGQMASPLTLWRGRRVFTGFGRFRHIQHQHP